MPGQPSPPSSAHSPTDPLAYSDTEARLLSAVRAKRPQVVVKADLLPGVSVLSSVALLGLGLAWVWSVLAPPERMWIASNGKPVPLLDEAYHRFDGLGIFVLINLGLGIAVGVAVWMLRERRGPVILIAAVVGAGVSAWLAMRTGVSFAGGYYPMPAAPHVGDVVAMAPQLHMLWAILAQPLAVAFVYGVLAASNGRYDLGRRLG